MRSEPFVFSMLMVVGCGAPTPNPADACTEPTIPIELAFRVTDGEPVCMAETEIEGSCANWALYAEQIELDPPTTCDPTTMSFTDVSTGDCIVVFIDCFFERTFDDPAYADCSSSNYDQCCEAQGGRFTPQLCGSL